MRKIQTTNEIIIKKHETIICDTCGKDCVAGNRTCPICGRDYCQKDMWGKFSECFDGVTPPEKELQDIWDIIHKHPCYHCMKISNEHFPAIKKLESEIQICINAEDLLIEQWKTESLCTCNKTQAGEP